MRKLLPVKWMASIVFALGTAMVSAQNFPAKPIRLIAPEPGGGSDFSARIIVQAVASGNLGQPIIIDNRPSNLIAEAVSRTAADGYTIAITGAPTWVTPLLQKTSYDPIQDLTFIVWVTSTPHVLVVHPSLRVKSLKELIALARKHPGQLNYGSGPNGSETHLAGELLKSTAGIDIVQIAYKGAGPAVNALLGGETSLMFLASRAAMGHVRAGRLSALGIATLEPSPVVPELPTLSATGLPGFEMATESGIFGPAGMPAAIVDRFNQEFVRVLARPDVKEKFHNAGAEVIGGPPSKFAAKVRAETVKWSKVIKSAGIRVQ